MLFVRCRGGISHNPAESVEAADVAVAIDALERFADVPYDLVIRGGPTRDVAIQDGAIAAFAAGSAAREEIDARGLHVLPGVIDAHVHFNEPGRTDWEGWATGTRALAAGGATACVEMPLNAHPPTIDGAAFDAKVAAARAAAVVDFALWGGIVPGNLDRLDELAERGVVGFKAFMCDSGIDGLPGRRRRRALRRDGARRRARPAGRRSRRERPGRASRAPRRATDWRDFVASRPVEAELEAIERALRAGRETGCALHVVHVSTGRGVALVAEARRAASTRPARPARTTSLLDRGGPRAPRHAREVRAAAAHRRRARARCGRRSATDRLRRLRPLAVPAGHEGAATSRAAWGGIAGCQTLLALLLDSGDACRCEQVAMLTSADAGPPLPAAARAAWSLGADADLVLVDLAASRARARGLHDRHRLSPFAGRALRGRVVAHAAARHDRLRTTARSSPARGGRLLTPDDRGDA